MKFFLPVLLLMTSLLAAEPRQTEQVEYGSRQEVRIGKLRTQQGVFGEEYPNALPCLLEHIGRETAINLVTVPIQLESFLDERLRECPFVYANYAARKWEFSEEERNVLRKYLESGGFLFIDGGITASFLRGHGRLGLHHSFAEWEATPELKEAFAEVLPGLQFTPLRRSDPLYAAFYHGLPDTSLLPDTVREYTIREKWPDGTYSAVAIRIHGRIAVLCTPIIAMGWGRDTLGRWTNSIRFRILEGTDRLDEALKVASYGGERFEVTREDGGKDILYCQEPGLPAWCHEPDGRWRVFRYYSSREISDFTHVFYTRLGTNILVHALTQ